MTVSCPSPKRAFRGARFSQTIAIKWVLRQYVCGQNRYCNNIQTTGECGVASNKHNVIREYLRCPVG